ncbi:MAG: 3-oxoadipyl-CoA thiolase, partial [Cyanobacteria bacterium NC_groundwater_1444_Ag_S-0.65um_54_12]|nr:3-oxoadipyl-CoA thiolase [Cyanobacteria bacterium NC_groundwater_1444_Ag_S-0.65um_54_12]
VQYAVTGVEPELMGLGPISAVRLLEARAGIAVHEVDLVELGEAFAAQVLACDRELVLDPDRVNVNGGNIALGHPIACTGARMVTTLVHEMARRKAKTGLATLCVSGGMGAALLLERA